MRRKVSVITGARSDYGILRPVLREIESSKKLDLYLIVTGMHLSHKHGKTIDEIKKDGFKIYTSFDMIPKGNSNYYMAKSIGKGIIELSKIFNKLKPDINLILGDRDEVLASAIAAYHMNIPNAHIHGGDKTKAGIDEYNRHIITKSSNIHFAASKTSYNRILKMGENPKFVFLTGSPSVDEIFQQKITTKTQLEEKYNLKLYGNEIILLQHPVTTQTSLSRKQIHSTLQAICKFGNTVIAIMPNSDAGNKSIFDLYNKYSRKYNFFKTFKNFSRQDYFGFLKNCGVLIGNSSSGLIEGSYFDIPVVNLGIRQKDRDGNANVYNIGDFSTKEIYKTISKALKSRHKKKHKLFGKGGSSKKIVRILEQVSLNNELIQKQIFY